MLSQLGNFEVKRPRAGEPIKVRHVPSGLDAGVFSHLAVKSVRDAVAGVSAVEVQMGTHLAALRGDSTLGPFQRAAYVFRDLMLAQFPNGAWSRR